jgi:hypothetical protein
MLLLLMLAQFLLLLMLLEVDVLMLAGSFGTRSFLLLTLAFLFERSSISFEMSGGAPGQ